jgi:predicted kinase
LGASTITLALVAGYAGSGKSEAGKILASATGWAMLDKDTLSRPMTERLLEALGGDPDDRHSPMYLEHARPLEYACLMKSVWENLECGISVVAVAPFLAESADAQWNGARPAQVREDRGPIRNTLGGQRLGVHA